MAETVDDIELEAKKLLEEYSVDDLVGCLQVMKAMKLDVKWEKYGSRLMYIYVTAIKKVYGDEVAERFKAGVFGKIGD